MTSVACIGEAMVELRLDESGTSCAQIGFAGDTLNTAVYLKRAAPELDVQYVTRLGSDSFSDRLIAFIESEGVGTGNIGRSATRIPGLYAISTDADGERSFTYWRENSAARELFAVGTPDLESLASFEVLFFSAITLAILTSEARQSLFDWLVGYRAGGGRVAFDSNYRPGLWTDEKTAKDSVAAAWRTTDIALPSIDDERNLFGDPDEAAVLERLRNNGVTAGALKRGNKGPRPLSPGRPEISFPVAERVVDTTAAGDSFNAGYLAAILTERNEAEALRAGHACAVKVIGERGAITPREV